jgi:hypothetical protein
LVAHDEYHLCVLYVISAIKNGSAICGIAHH